MHVLYMILMSMFSVPDSILGTKNTGHKHSQVFRVRTLTVDGQGLCSQVPRTGADRASHAVG